MHSCQTPKINQSFHVVLCNTNSKFTIYTAYYVPGNELKDSYLLSHLVSIMLYFKVLLVSFYR